VSHGSTLDLSVELRGPGFSKTSGGLLRLGGANAFTGDSFIQGGRVQALKPDALNGSPGRTVHLSQGGVLDLTSDDPAPQYNVNLDAADGTLNVGRLNPAGGSSQFRMGELRTGGGAFTLTSGANSSARFAGWTVLGNTTFDSGADVTIDGPVNQSGAFTVVKNGAGRLLLQNGSTYGFAGQLRVNTGRLELNNAPTNQTLGYVDAFGGATILLDNAHQLRDNAPVTLNASRLNLQSFADTIGTLNLTNGVVDGAADGGGLGITASINVAAGAGSAINAPLKFDGVRGVYVEPNATLPINGPIGNLTATPGGIEKVGGGTLVLAGPAANTYTGPTRLRAGELRLNKSPNAGSPGDVEITGGTLRLLADHQIGDNAAVSVSGAGAKLALDGHRETLGSLSVAASAQADLGPTGVLKTRSLTVDNGTLDVNRGTLLVDYATGSPLDDILAKVNQAYGPGGGPHWTSPGITSSAAAADASLFVAVDEASRVLGLTPGQTALFNGASVDDTTVIVRLTRRGDATLDGAVDFNDLVPLAQHYNQAAPAWSSGDFTGDGFVDFSDLVVLAQNYNSSLTPGAAAPAFSASFAGDVASAFASVPEPSALAAIAACGFAASARRRRSRPHC
jgi:autotransporter-associated beta strand protein